MNSNLLDQDEQTQELQVQIPPDVQRGVYANQLLVVHNQEEFILDFILATPPAGVVNSRVLVSPAHAKRIVAVLQENIARYEEIFGQINTAAPAGMPGHLKAN
jgi:hypothetical protein